jgi:hypothetical protein
VLNSVPEFGPTFSRSPVTVVPYTSRQDRERQAQRLVCSVGSVVTFVVVIRECERIYSVTSSVQLTISNRSVSFHLLYKHIRAEIISYR